MYVIVRNRSYRVGSCRWCTGAWGVLFRGYRSVLNLFTLFYSGTVYGVIRARTRMRIATTGHHSHTNCCV